MDRQQRIRVGQTASEDTSGRFGFNCRSTSTLGNGKLMAITSWGLSQSWPWVGVNFLSLVGYGGGVRQEGGKQGGGAEECPWWPWRPSRKAQGPSVTTPSGRALGRTSSLVKTCSANRIGEGGHKYVTLFSVFLLETIKSQRIFIRRTWQ